ncbi:MAG: hypothetical protein M3Y74_19290, partial [Chloroflexota bacterium]|nr:hypothetical protein [Chloroflexota bacterium]
PTAIMGPGGRLMAWAGHPWAAWDTPEGDQESIVTLLRRVAALRRGAGRDFLVFGRLLRPLPVQEIEQVTWSCDGQIHTMAAVLHAHWEAADGRTALALANWTADERVVHLDAIPAHDGPTRYHLQCDTLDMGDLDRGQAHPARLTLPPLGVALVEWGKA